MVATKTATAATTAAVASNSFFTDARYTPARERSTAALSVRSQVNSGSVRPKWPNAAVFL